MRVDGAPSASTTGRRPSAPQRALCAARALRVRARNDVSDQPEASPMTSLAQWVQAADAHCAGLLKRAPVPGRGGGHGMIAQQEIQKGDKLVSVPRKLWMTSKTARASPICGDIIQRSGADDWTGMCLHLLCERRQRDASLWQGYLSQLPDQKEHPLAWTEEREWLDGSPMAAKLAQRQAQVEGDTAQLLEAGAATLAFPGDAEDAPPLVSESAMTWAAATLLSRSFNLEMPPPGRKPRAGGVTGDGSGSGSGSSSDSDDPEAPHISLRDLSAPHDAPFRVPPDDELFGEQILALVPWADGINHCSSAGERSVLQYDEAHDAAVLFAHRTYAAGEEVFDSYGTRLTPADLLLDYGFVDPKNKFAAITVPAASLIEGAEPAGLNSSLLTGVSQTFSGAPEMRLTDTGIDDTLLSYVRCAVASEEQLRKAGWAGEWQRGQGLDDVPLDVMARLVQPDDINTEARVLETLLTWADGQLKRYPTAIQNDREELLDGKTPWLRVQVLRALIAEKEAILGMQTVLRDHMQQLKEGCPLDTLYS